MAPHVAIPDGALDLLARRDRRLGRLIARVGPFAMRRQTGRSHYQLLARSIIFQQLSGRAARTIYQRVHALGEGGRFPSPPRLLELPDTLLRAAGLSRQKIAALRDLAARVVDGRLRLSRIGRLDDPGVIEALCQVRGIGRWTAEMFLMFRLGRLDVLPVDDLGVRKGLMVLDRRRALPSPRELAERGERWRPYRSVASWYLWRAVDNLNVGGW